MDTTSAGALVGIGNTPLVELVRVVPDGSARVMVKLEFANPTGSMKDRMARTAIEGAIRNGYRHRRRIHRWHHGHLIGVCVRRAGVPAPHRVL